jgi:hypothetical protein
MLQNISFENSVIRVWRYARASSSDEDDPVRQSTARDRAGLRRDRAAVATVVTVARIRQTSRADHADFTRFARRSSPMIA